MRYVVALSLILAIGCGGTEKVTEKSTPIVKPVATNQPVVRKTYEAPEGISQRMVDHFSELQEFVTEDEWSYFLDRVAKTCDGRVAGIGSNVDWENRMSPETRQALNQWREDGRILPAKLNTRKNRIEIAGLAMPDVKRVEFIHNGFTVFYVKNDYVSIVQLDGHVTKNGSVGSGSSGERLIGTDAHKPFINSDLDWLHRNITDAWHDQWREHFSPRAKAGEFTDEISRVRGQLTHLEKARIHDFFHNKFELPDFPNKFKHGNVDLLMIYVDEDWDIISPKDPEVAKLMESVYDAPQAEPSEIAEYNRIHSPDAYDCVGE